MLNYHSLPAQTIETKIGIFKHFLSLGSYDSPFRVPHIYALSRVELYAGGKFILNDHIANKPE